MEYSLKTTKAQEFIDITGLVNKAVSESGVKDGISVVFVPHSTLSNAYPEHGEYLHVEGNSHAQNDPLSRPVTMCNNSVPLSQKRQNIAFAGYLLYYK